MKIQIIESPYSAENREARRFHYLYARACQRDALLNYGAHLALAAHVNTIGALVEDGERDLGITAHLDFLTNLANSDLRDETAVILYTDLGLSVGMHVARDHAFALGLKTWERALGIRWGRGLPKGVGDPF